MVEDLSIQEGATPLRGHLSPTCTQFPLLILLFPIDLTTLKSILHCTKKPFILFSKIIKAFWLYFQTSEILMVITWLITDWLIF